MSRHTFPQAFVAFKIQVAAGSAAVALISATVAAAAAFIHFTFPSLFSSIQQIRVCFQPASLPPPVWLSDDENSNVVDRGGGAAVAWEGLPGRWREKSSSFFISSVTT